MSASFGPYPCFARPLFLAPVALGLLLMTPATLVAQSVPPALVSPPVQAPQAGPHGEKLPGMPKFHDPAPYDIDEHTGYKQIFDGKSFTGWDADPTIWRVEDGIMVGETLEGKPKGNNYIVYRGDKTRDFDLKLQMKIEKGGGGGIQYRSVTGVPWSRPQPAGQPRAHLEPGGPGRQHVPARGAEFVAQGQHGRGQVGGRVSARIVEVVHVSHDGLHPGGVRGAGNQRRGDHPCPRRGALGASERLDHGRSRVPGAEDRAPDPVEHRPAHHRLAMFGQLVIIQGANPFGQGLGRGSHQVRRAGRSAAGGTAR